MIPWLAQVARGALAFMALAAAAGWAAPAADPASRWLYRAYQTEDALPDISITGVAQTTDGYLWVATKGGLVCFNGQEFVPSPQSNLPTLPSRSVRALFRDQRDQLWMAMERGPVFCFKPEGMDSFTARDGLPGQRVLMMTQDGEGAVWIIYPTQLRRVVDGRVQSIPVPKNWTEPANLLAAVDRRGNLWCARGVDLGRWQEGRWHLADQLKARITALSAASKSSLWIAAGDRLFEFQPDQPLIERAQFPTNTVPRVLLEDRTGALWIGAAPGGLWRWDGTKLESVPTSDRSITCLFEDREENIWAGTDGGGLNLIRERTAALLGREAGLPFDAALSVTEDADGWLWVAAQGGRLARGKDGRWEAQGDWPGSGATCVAADPRGGVWVGSFDRGVYYFQAGAWRGWGRRDGLVSNNIRSLMVASNGDVWVASLFPNRLHRIRDGQVLAITNTTSIGTIRALAEGVDGTIWVGTAAGEIQRVLDGRLVPEPAIVEPVPLSVRSFLFTPDGSLWIGFAGDGMGQLKAGRYHRITTASGLADDFITHLLADDNGSLWLTGNRGLARVSLAQLDAVMQGRLPRVSARTFGRADGLPGLQPSRDSHPAAWRMRDGRLWFAMLGGLLVVEPDQIRDNPHPPPVQLERVSVDDVPVAVYNAGSPLQTGSVSNAVNLRTLAVPLRIGPGHRKLEIKFAALSFVSPENVQFRHRLSGFDKNWIEAGPQHNAVYPHLPAGEYEFRVLACNNAGVWNETGAALVLRVDPFFWETWWFKLGGGVGTVLLAGGSVFLVLRQRYRRKLLRLEARRALEHERARIAKDIHDDLGSSLTRISLLSQPARAEAEDLPAAQANLNQIHQTARDLTHAMGEVVWAVNPEHDTFDSLANYISHFAQNFLRSAGIRCRIEVPLQLPRRPLSAEVRHGLFLAFKEALNNVVKHSGATEVRISLVPGESGLELTVRDNGRGFTGAGVAAQTAGAEAVRPAPGNGLANMQSRLQEINGVCEIQSEPGTGTQITFRVKLKPHHEQPQA